MSATVAEPVPGARADRRRWRGLIVIALAQLMIVLDATIVNVALPTIQSDLDVSAADRQWVITAYTLAFAGLLLLGGRIADYTGRRRALLIALLGFAAASAVGGAAVTVEMLLAARAAQGAFGALLGPAALSLLSTTFSDPRERGTAFAVFGAVAASGSAVGLTLGGLLTEYLSWNWVLYVNVPIAVVAAAGALAFLVESRTRESVRFDVLGAALATGGLAALVYGFSRAVTDGWTAPLTLGLVTGGVAVLVVFVLTEALVGNPLLPLRIVAHRGRGGAYLTVLLLMVGVFGVFLFVSFYLQAVQGYSPLDTGVAFLALPGGVLVAAAATSRLMTRIPPRLPLGVGPLFAAAGMAWLTRLGVDSGYSAGVLPALIVVGLGMGMVFPTAVNLATYGVADRESGVASATLNSAQMVGASLGVALLNTIAANETAEYLAARPPGPQVRLTGLVEGYTLATAWGAGILAAAGLISLVLVKARLDGGTVETSPDGGTVKTSPDGGTVKTSPDGGTVETSPAGLPEFDGGDAGTVIALPGPGEHTATRTNGARRPEPPLVIGRVLSARGEPVGDATVCLLDPQGWALVRTTTGSDGSYTLQPPTRGAFVVVGLAVGHRPRAEGVTVAGHRARRDLALDPSTRVAGTVTTANSGAPVEQALVTVTDHAGTVLARLTTGADGGYVVDDLAAGSYTITATGPGPARTKVALRAGETSTTDFELHLDPL